MSDSYQQAPSKITGDPGLTILPSEADKAQAAAMHRAYEWGIRDGAKDEREACAKLLEPGGDARGFLETHIDRREAARLIRARST